MPPWPGALVLTSIAERAGSYGDTLKPQRQGLNAVQHASPYATQREWPGGAACLQLNIPAVWCRTETLVQTSRWFPALSATCVSAKQSTIAACWPGQCDTRAQGHTATTNASPPYRCSNLSQATSLDSMYITSMACVPPWTYTANETAPRAGHAPPRAIISTSMQLIFTRVCRTTRLQSAAEQ